LGGAGTPRARSAVRDAASLPFPPGIASYRLPERLMEETRGFRLRWGKHKTFIVLLASYVLAVVILFILSLKNRPFHPFLPKAGLIIGAFYPAISFIYYYHHYLKVEGLEATRPSVFAWVFPALATHIIVIFGFIILLVFPTKYFGRSFFSGFYHYGNLFKTFQKVQEDISNKHVGYEEIPKLYNYYRPLLRTEADEGNKSKEKDDTCPPNAQKEDQLAYCLQKFAQMATAINTIPFYLAITFGFLGALVFSLTDLVVRFNLLDLYPKNFVFYSVRFVVAMSLCATLANFVVSDIPTLFAPPIFFSIGYFPEKAVKYLEQKMTEFLGVKSERYERLPLSLVQGLTEEKAFRMREIGIEDVQHLAVADIEELRKNLPYSTELLCDWISQSLLILYFSKKIEALRDVGVRTILDLQECLLKCPEQELESCAKKCGLPPKHLQHVAKIMATAHMQTRLGELKTCLEEQCQVKLE
jgi:hypothetical protein